MVILLLLCKVIFSVISILNLSTNLLIYIASFIAGPNAMYLVLIVDVETVWCFLFLHNTTALLKKKQ